MRVGSGNDALARKKHVGMTQVANVPQIDRQVVHSDMKYVDAIDRCNRTRIVDALSGFEKDMDRRRAICRYHQFSCGNFAISYLRQERNLRAIPARWEASGIDDLLRLFRCLDARRDNSRDTPVAQPADD